MDPFMVPRLDERIFVPCQYRMSKGHRSSTAQHGSPDKKAFDGWPKNSYGAAMHYQTSTASDRNQVHKKPQKGVG